MDTTPNLLLPYIMASQAQKHVTHNEALRSLDAIVQIAIKDRDLATPPATPGEGDRYIVAAGATGAWTGQAAAIAAWQDGGWRFYTPGEGWVAWIVDENVLLAFDGSEWVHAAAASALQNVPMLGINATADTTNRLVLASAASLFDHAGAGHQHKINKNAADDTASLLLATNSSGRAELGTTGDDDLHIKVSADGSEWHEAIVVSKDTGNVGLGAPPVASRLEVYGTTATAAQLKTRHEATSASGGGGMLLHHNNAAGALPATGDRLGYLLFGTTDTGVNRQGGGVLAFADGAYSSTSLPTRIVFETAPSGSTARQERLRIDASGNVGIGAVPVCKLDVDGPVRVKSYAVAALPPANAGAGQIIYVSDEAGGAVLAFSDGTSWRRVTDRAVVT
jgi:hypothetical protein